MLYAIDLNNENNQNIKNIDENDNIKVINGDAEEILKSNVLLTKLDVVYMRWFLHSMPYDKAQNIFKYAYNSLKQNGLICIEVRSYNDEELKKISIYDGNDKSFKTTHKRWLYSKDMLENLSKINDCDCKIIFCEEGYFSHNIECETINPLLFRIVFKKQTRNSIFEKSENYSLYKHILPQMAKKTFRSYRDMNKFNEIIKEHNIKYIGLSGTALGINRHGGIIPWDNDIDIGFIPSEWTKLKNIQNILIKSGLNLRDDNLIHCHFGLVDCFKLKLNKNEKMYKGPCETFCTEDEYNKIKKQIHGNTWVYLPFDSHISLKHRYGDDYFFFGDVNDNFHFKDENVKKFKLNEFDKCYQIK